DDTPSRSRTSGECIATGDGNLNCEYACCANCPGVGSATTGPSVPVGNALAHPTATPSQINKYVAPVPKSGPASPGTRLSGNLSTSSSTLCDPAPSTYVHTGPPEPPAGDAFPTAAGLPGAPG